MYLKVCQLPEFITAGNVYPLHEICFLKLLRHARKMKVLCNEKSLFANMAKMCKKIRVVVVSLPQETWQVPSFRLTSQLSFSMCEIRIQWQWWEKTCHASTMCQIDTFGISDSFFVIYLFPKISNKCHFVNPSIVQWRPGFQLVWT